MFVPAENKYVIAMKDLEQHNATDRNLPANLW